MLFYSKLCFSGATRHGDSHNASQIRHPLVNKISLKVNSKVFSPYFSRKHIKVNLKNWRKLILKFGRNIKSYKMFSENNGKPDVYFSYLSIINQIQWRRIPVHCITRFCSDALVSPPNLYPPWAKAIPVPYIWARILPRFSRLEAWSLVCEF